jgi:hypothetical protein
MHMKARAPIFSKTEKRIENNSKMLTQTWPGIVKQFNETLPKTEEEKKKAFDDMINHDIVPLRYVVFHNGTYKMAGSFEEANILGEQKFGKTSGFVVRKII